MAAQTFFNTGGDEGHGDVPLNAIHPHPGGHQRQHPGNQIHQPLWRIVLIQPFLPQLIQPCASDDQRWVYL
jgi:hypothetical protein